MPDPATPAAGQVWSAQGYAANAGFVPLLAADLLDTLAPQPGEAILDLGCGDGVLTARIAAAGASVTGLEPDPALAAAARARGIAVLERDAHQPFGAAAYDAVFSNAALHWMRAPETVHANIARALRPGGRLVAEQGGFGNIAAIVTAMKAALQAERLPERARNPWDFPSPTLQRERLERAGLQVTEMRLFPRPTPLPTGMAGWLETFAGPFLLGLPEQTRARVLERALALLSDLQDPREGWIADYVRLRFTAVKPG
ncbi:methyltransferase domain-containing protein [Rhodobacteraceae bacterium 2CG4]|uniref:Methyltransferase domain-containing protein n=1 Tax=Halovulum marinum TaxID=2662447 RepID=A0A6L5YZ30_9RHOB|nr:class I SAM-dependent methyltransferase [Halovulum marinum]MSU88954.1 methyltransferase domain-containing protein [Halovulum marinum]